jgi:hypothetical protein
MKMSMMNSGTRISLLLLVGMFLLAIVGFANAADVAATTMRGSHSYGHEGAEEVETQVVQRWLQLPSEFDSCATDFFETEVVLTIAGDATLVTQAQLDLLAAEFLATYNALNSASTLCDPYFMVITEVTATLYDDDDRRELLEEDQQQQQRELQRTSTNIYVLLSIRGVCRGCATTRTRLTNDVSRTPRRRRTTTTRQQQQHHQFLRTLQQQRQLVEEECTCPTESEDAVTSQLLSSLNTNLDAPESAVTFVVSVNQVTLASEFVLPVTLSPTMTPPSQTPTAPPAASSPVSNSNSRK